MSENTRIKSEPANGVAATLMVTVVPLTVMLLDEMLPAVPLARVYLILLTVVMALSPLPQFTVTSAYCPASVTF